MKARRLQTPGRSYTRIGGGHHLDKVSQIIDQNASLFPAEILPPRKDAKTQAAKRGRAAKKKGMPGEPRNYEQETESAQLALVDALADYTELRRSGVSPQLVQIAQALIFCGLPYRETTEDRISRVSRDRDGNDIRVTFYALASDKEGNRIPMPYGADRTFLHWCIDKAIKLKSPFVPLEKAADFLTEVGHSKSGQNVKRLRDAYRRLSGLTIFVERYGKENKDHESDEDRSLLPIIEDSRVPASIQPRATPITGPAGLRFGEKFFKEINRHHVPFPWEILRKLEQKPQMQDYILFLHWRSYAARTRTLITWKQLRGQLWHADSNTARIRVRFDNAIKLLKGVWPELSAEATKKGLMIGPPAKGQHLIPSHNVETKYLNG